MRSALLHAMQAWRERVTTVTTQKQPLSKYTILSSHCHHCPTEHRGNRLKDTDDHVYKECMFARSHILYAQPHQDHQANPMNNA